MQKHQREALAAAQRGDLLPHAAHAGKPPGDAIGHVRPQRAADLQQFVHRQAQPPQAVERDERGGAIGAAPAQSGANGDALGKRDARAKALAYVFPQRLRRLQNEVAPAHGQRTAVDRQRQPAGAFKRQYVGQVDALHEHVQFMVAVVAAGAHVQRPVDLRLRPRGDPHVLSPIALVGGARPPPTIIACFPPPRVKNRLSACIFSKSVYNGGIARTGTVGRRRAKRDGGGCEPEAQGPISIPRASPRKRGGCAR